MINDPTNKVNQNIRDIYQESSGQTLTDQEIQYYVTDFHAVLDALKQFNETHPKVTFGELITNYINDFYLSYEDQIDANSNKAIAKDIRTYTKEYPHSEPYPEIQ